MTLPRLLCLLATGLAGAALASPAAAADRHLAIVGGSDAPAGTWPSIAYLRGTFHEGNGDEQAFACTGSVVAPSWILTAAHCTFGSGRSAPESMVATLGVMDSTDPAGERIPVDRFVPDPDYNTDNLLGDAGLVHLAHPTSRPAMPLATTAGSYVSPSGVPNAAGWGAVDEEGTQLPNLLQQAYLQVRTPDDCKAFVSDFDPATQTCAGTPGATSACLGDSGGPLVEMDSATGQPALWGVTSYGPQTGEDLPTCSVEIPSVYTWIPAYASFIQSIIAGAPTAAGSPPSPAPARSTRTRSAACRKARSALRAARGRERAALQRLRAARDRMPAGSSTALAQRRFDVAHARSRRAVAIAARRCRA